MSPYTYPYDSEFALMVCNVYCPSCGCQAGVQCRTKTGNKSLPHSPRVRAWKAAGRPSEPVQDKQAA